MKVKKLFQKTLFGIFVVFGCIGLSTSILTVYTVDTHLSEEYQSNGSNIAKTIADSSVDILLNRNLTALQSLIDQFVEIQGIKYIYITDEKGEFVAHTFVPGIPAEIRADDAERTAPVERSLPGMGDFIEVGSPILAGVAGTVHVGMDTGLIALKIQQAIGRQVYLISIIFIVGVFAAILAGQSGRQAHGRPARLHRRPGPAGRSRRAHKATGRNSATRIASKLLERADEVGQIARLFSYLAELADDRRPQAATTGDSS